MQSVGNRLLSAIAQFFAAILNIRIKLKFVLIAFVLIISGAVAYTYYTMLNNVGGKADYAEAMRYIEIKDVIDDNFIDEVDRAALGDYAAAAMVSGLNDPWSRYMSSDEYKTYQLSAANEYQDIGISMLKDDSGGFQVIGVNPTSPADCGARWPPSWIICCPTAFCSRRWTRTASRTWCSLTECASSCPCACW